MRPRIARSVVKVPERQREGMSSKHIDDVKRLPCLYCGKFGVDPHHLQRGLPPKERGTSWRASDQYAVPMCRQHHEDCERGGDDEAWFAAHGIQAREVARGLWTQRGDLSAMFRIVARSLNGRKIYVDV